MTDDAQTEPGARIPLASLPNLRDIGGYPVTDGGRVRTGVLYRSVALDKLVPHDAAELERRGIRTVFDLRTKAERAAEPDRLPGGAAEVVCDVLADSVDAAPAEMLALIKDTALAARALDGGEAVRLFHDAYRRIVSSDSALRAYRRFFTVIAAVEQDHAALFHCTTGKDRTGWAAAATLLLLGVDEQHVFHDHELTNREPAPGLRPADRPVRCRRRRPRHPQSVPASTRATCGHAARGQDATRRHRTTPHRSVPPTSGRCHPPTAAHGFAVRSS